MPAYLKALIPCSTRRAPGALLSNAEVTAALEAITARADVVQVKTRLPEAIDMLQDPSATRHSQKLFDEVCTTYRSELYLTPDTSAVRRLAIHESLMAAGYYARATNLHNPKLEAVRFVVNHYNYDMRRDSHLVRRVHDSILTADETPEADALARELLMLERYLFGANRLRPIAGNQFLMLGIQMNEFKDEKTLLQVLELPVVKNYGNFVYIVRDEVSKKAKVSQSLVERWKVANVTCGLEQETEEGKSTIFSEELLKESNVANTGALGTRSSANAVKKLDYDLRFLVPAPILPFWERVKLWLLDAWVYFFGFWVMFWLVDEEVFAILTLLYTRYHSRKVLEEESKASGGGGKVYMASSKAH